MAIVATPEEKAYEQYLENLFLNNGDKRFVQRILRTPVMLGDNHAMQWAEDNGRFYAFPAIMEDPETGELTNYDSDSFMEALRRRDFIRFDTAKEAQDFSRNYQKYWNR